MTDNSSPYIERKPGELITAEDWNEMQQKIKEDIQKQVQDSIQEITKKGVSRADNADKFDEQKSSEWITKLDQLYAPQVHDHKGLAVYQRYFLELETFLAGPSPRLQPAVLVHNMGRIPIVQVYELMDLPFNQDSAVEIPSWSRKNHKFCFCGPEYAPDPEASGFITKSWDERPWGNSLDNVIDELARDLTGEQKATFKAKFRDTFTLGAWLTNIEQKLFEPGPAIYHFDPGSIYRTQWIKDREKTTVAELIDKGEWQRSDQPATAPRLVYRPRLADTQTLPPDLVTSPIPSYGVMIEIFHLNMNEIEIWPKNDQKMHLMVLLQT